MAAGTDCEPDTKMKKNNCKMFFKFALFNICTIFYLHIMLFHRTINQNYSKCTGNAESVQSDAEQFKVCTAFFNELSMLPSL